MANKAILLGAFALLGWWLPAYAHWADLAAAEVVVDQRQVQMTLTFPTGLVKPFDDDQDGTLSPSEVRAHQGQLSRYFADQIKLSAAGQTGVLEVTPAQTALSIPRLNPGRKTHSTLLLTYRWPAPISDLKINYGLFLPGVSTASCIATILYKGQVQEVVFRPDNREFSLGLSGPWQTLTSFVKLGIYHILSGYDHLLFLLSLLMLGGGLSYLLKVVTAFTLAHSITLSLAVLNVIALAPRLVESGIALSIAYVAAENLLRRDLTRLQQRRWLITFAFGLVHGLGFASILKSLGIPKASLALSLVSFNLGVEIGQIGFVLAVFGLLLLLRRWPWEATVRRAISLGAVAAGLYWFIQRAFLSA